MANTRAEMRRRWDGDFDSFIRVLVPENPKAIGSKARERFACYRTGMTVRQYVDACAHRPRPEDALIDITWDLAHGFIQLLPPGSASRP